MTHIKNIGLIEYGTTEQIYELNQLSRLPNYTIKKVLVHDMASVVSVQMHYPDAEIIFDKDQLLQDESIELVLVSAPKGDNVSFNSSSIVGEFLKVGKQVRIL